MMGDDKSALIAMSGGVDSSVAASDTKNRKMEEQSLKREEMEKRRRI